MPDDTHPSAVLLVKNGLPALYVRFLSFHGTRLGLSHVRRAKGSASLSSAVLLVGDLFQPFNVFPIDGSRNGDMRHGGGG